MTNWIHDRNRFALANPPVWWLRMLQDFDPLLRVIPSRQYPVYILARQAKANPVLDQHAGFNPDRDIQMLAAMNLVYVTVLQGTGLDQSATGATFHTGIFNELRRRDITRNGGWEKYVKAAEEFEEETRRQQLAKVADAESHLDSEAYKLLKRRTGERIQAPGPTADGRPHPTL